MGVLESSSIVPGQAGASLSARTPKTAVLVVGVGAEAFAKLEPLLGRESFEIDRFPRGKESLELIDEVGFDALLARFPLRDISMEDFLERVREPQGPCRHTPLVLIANPEDEEEARTFLGRGANRVLALSETAEHLQNEVSRLLRVAPRLDLRLMTSLEIQLEENTSLSMCQVHNISKSGMLVQCSVGYPLGSKIRFELTLPGESRDISGEAEVVRHTVVGREAVRGVGIRFLELHKDSSRRLEHFIEQELDEVAMDILSGPQD